MSGSSLRKILGGLIAIAVVTTGMAGLGAASLLAMLHVPRRGSDPPVDTRPVQIEAADHAILKASWLQHEGESACVLFLHGLGGTRDQVNRFVPMLRSGGYAILAPDSRAHGESGGDMVTFGLLEKQDAIRWTHWMRTQGCERVYGLGESLGASVLIQAAAVEPAFAAIVADAPSADLLKEAEHRSSRLFPFPAAIATPIAKLAVAGGDFYARHALDIDFSQVSPVRSITQTQTPILLIHGTADRRTPPSNSERLHAASPATTALWLVPGAGHVRSFSVAPQEYRRRVLDWFQTPRP